MKKKNSIERITVEIDRNTQKTEPIRVIAKALILSANGIKQQIHSGGIEAIICQDEDYYLDNEIIPNQLAKLRKELESFGFGKRTINLAMKKYIIQ